MENSKVTSIHSYAAMVSTSNINSSTNKINNSKINSMVPSCERNAHPVGTLGISNAPVDIIPKDDVSDATTKEWLKSNRILIDIEPDIKSADISSAITPSESNIKIFSETLADLKRLISDATIRNEKELAMALLEVHKRFG